MKDPNPLDPTSELDAGWGDDDLDDLEESGPTARRIPESDRRPTSSKPLSLAPPSNEQDELDEGWGEIEDAADSETASFEPAAGTREKPATGARIAFKKAQRELARKNTQHAERRKKTRKAERKAQRREQARRAREEREREARAERERQAQARRARKKAGAPAKDPLPGSGQRSSGKRRLASPLVERTEARRAAARAPAEIPPMHEPTSSPKAAKKRRRGASKKAARQRALRRQRLAVLIGLLILAVGTVLWWLARS